MSVSAKFYFDIYLFTFRVTTDVNIIYQVQVFFRLCLLREALNIEWNVLLPLSKLKCRSQWLCGLRRQFAADRTLAGVAVSNPAGGMDVCRLWVLCVVRLRSLRQADHSSRGVLPSELCMRLIVKPRQWEGPGLLGAVAPMGGKYWDLSKSHVIISQNDLINYH
jgi:hypothetical protein